MIPLSAACPTLARTLTFDSFGAYRGGRALSDPLDLRLLPGTVLGVVGPNGVGKSSLLSALAHAGAHSYGRASYGDRDLSSMNARSRASIVSMLPQDLRAPDEPTSALDLFHQRAVEQTVRRLGNDGKIVVAALHDLTLALNACTQVLLLKGDGDSHSGSPAEVLRPELVHAAYGVHTTIHTTPHGRRYLSTD